MRPLMILYVVCKLTDEERENLEGYITIEECSKVLQTFPAGKSTGDDGFKAKFYNCFFDLVRRDSVNSFNTAYKEGKDAKGRFLFFRTFKLAPNYSFKRRLKDRVNY